MPEPGEQKMILVDEYNDRQKDGLHYYIVRNTAGDIIHIHGDPARHPKAGDVVLLSYLGNFSHIMGVRDDDAWGIISINGEPTNDL